MSSSAAGIPSAVKGTILAVDDTPAYPRLFSRLLEKHGYAVRSAPGAEEALRLLAGDLPDLILLDVMMPGMNGFEMCRHLKADARTRDIPVIFISGADRVDDRVAAFACGGVDYIAKPFYEEEVLARIQTHMALRSLQKNLEERVRERTADLVAANTRLSAEIVERRRAEEKLRSVLEATPEAIVSVDGRREIVLVNSQAETLFGFRRDELLGKPIDMLIPERFRPAHDVLSAGYLVKPRQRPMGNGRGLVGLCRDGREFPAEISLSPLVQDDDTLVICLIRDIGERMRIERELVDSRERLRELAAHLDTVREKERKRIAGEIHDELGALLTALKMDISLLRMGIAEGAAIAPRLEQIRTLVDEIIYMVRRVATQLRPTALNLGIVPALEWLVEDFGRRAGIACSLDAGGEIEMDDARATAVFRIVQESLTNVARHAAATRVEVTLTRDATGIGLTVRDDGRGFDPQALGGGTFGLLGIRERALLLGAMVDIDSAPGRGTTVAIAIPAAVAAR